MSDNDNFKCLIPYTHRRENTEYHLESISLAVYVLSEKTGAQ